MAIKAAQYVRMSTDQQPLSLDIQKQAIRAYAVAHDIEIVETYEDEAKSGLRLKSRAGMQRLLSDVEKSSCPYRKVLVLDVTRWGRYQDVDESAYYEFHCRKNGVDVVYVAEPFSEHASPFGAVFKNLKRIMAAETSRELSVKIRAGQDRSVQLGYKAGGPPYLGYARQAVAADGTPKGVLQKGERKPLLTDRVRFVLGPPEEIALVRRIFETFAGTSLTTFEIADLLNTEGLTTRQGRPFTKSFLDRMLRCELYLGTYVYGTRRRSMGRPLIVKTEPTRIEGRVDRIIDEATWRKAQWKLNHPVARKPNRRPKHTRTRLILSLREALRQQPNIIQSSFQEFGLPGIGVFRRVFGTYSAACEAVGRPWSSGRGSWSERRIGGHRLVRRFYRDVITLLETYGVTCSCDRVRCTLDIGGTQVKVKTAWPILRSADIAWHFTGENWRSGWLLLMRVNQDGTTGKDFYLLPPGSGGQIPRQIPPTGLVQFENHRIQDVRTLAARLLALHASGTPEATS